MHKMPFILCRIIQDGKAKDAKKKIRSSKQKSREAAVKELM